MAKLIRRVFSMTIRRQTRYAPNTLEYQNITRVITLLNSDIHVLLDIRFI